MKNKHKAFPLIFLIFGILLIAAISGLSIRKHVKSGSINEKSQQASIGNNKEKNKNDSEIFFDKPKDMPSQNMIKVYKEKRILELYGDEKLIGRFKIGLGRDPWKDKEEEGDNRTPEGSYYICSRTGETKYTYFMGLSYPNINDAQRGLEKGLIDKDVYNRIKQAIDEKKQPTWNTPLGGAVGIHGGGNKYDWTYGCIALTNEDINIVKQYAPIGTLVEIYK